MEYNKRKIRDRSLWRRTTKAVNNIYTLCRGYILQCKGFRLRIRKKMSKFDILSDNVKIMKKQSIT